jgi:hypothetical protein
MLFSFLSLKIGIRWQYQPFNWTVPAITGAEGIFSLKADIFKDIFSFDSGTDVFTSFDFNRQGITVSAVNRILFALQSNLKIGPRFRLFYNTLVGHLAYFFDVSMIMDFNL